MLNIKDRSWLKLNFDKIFLFLISLIVIFSRIPFASKYLTTVNSVNYGLSFIKYDISYHQPHPPGYILYVMLGKMINIFFNDPNISMILISIIFTIFTIIITYFLAKRFFSRTIAIISVFLLVFNPIVWYYGEIAEIYMCEAFFATLIAYLSYLVYVGEKKFIYISAIVLGLSGGFRQDTLIFMFPLWFVCLYYSKTTYKDYLKIFFVLCLSIIIWLIPILISSGSIGNYLYLTNEITTRAFSTTSLFYGATFSEQFYNAFELIMWSLMGIGIVGVICVLLEFVLKTKKIFSLFDFRNFKILFLTLWILPAFLFYAVIHIANPGYILIYLPAILMVVGYFYIVFALDLTKILNRFTKQQIIIFLVLISVIFNISLFIYSEKIETGVRDISSPLHYDGINSNIEKFFQINFFALKFINEKNNQQGMLISSILKLTNHNPNNTIIIAKDRILVRNAVYYLPEYQFYIISNKPNIRINAPNVKNINNDEVIKIPVNSSIKRIIWIINDDSTFFKQIPFNINTIYIPNGKIYYSDVNIEINEIDINNKIS